MKDVILLPQREFAILKKAVEVGEISSDNIAKALGKRREDIMRDLAELEARGLIKTLHMDKYSVKITKRGLNYLSSGLPEERLIEALKRLGGSARFKDLMRESGLSGKELSAALGRLRELGIISVGRDRVSISKGGGEILDNFRGLIRDLKNNLTRLSKGAVLTQIPDWLSELRRRGMVEVEVKREVIVRPTSDALRKFREGKVREAKIITRITPEVIVSGAWRDVIIKEFDLSIDVPTLKPRRLHPYIQFLSYVREVLIGLGFKEVRGPFIELALWNFDALFVPQYHPSRMETDVFYVKNKLELGGEKQLVGKIGKIHESVLKYRWLPEEALRPVLRTHTTPVSIRTLRQLGEGEYRAFSLDRVFRPDTPDPTHLMEFHQLEGIIVGRDVTFSNLLGFFKEFADRLSLGEVRFRPAYFPFTEPSVEGYIKHPELGWIEVFPGGMFRREVLEPLGLSEDYKVAAWGIGIDRIAMMVLGLNDIRDLYTNRLELIESLPLPKELMK